MKKIKSCIICLKPIASTLTIAIYCSACRGIVSKIQTETKKIMDKHNIPRPDDACVDCGKPATCYDHRYYGMPLEVDPVCVACNTNRGPALDVVELARGRLMPIEEIDTSLDNLIDKTETKALKHALLLHRNNMTQAAKYLKISYRSIRYRVQRLGINE